MKGPAFFQGQIIMKWQKYIDKILKSFSQEPLDLCTMHPVVKGTQIYSKKGLRLFSRGDSENTLTKLKKIFFSRTAGTISTKPATVHPWVKKTQVCLNEEPFNSHKVNNEVFFLIINIMILFCVYRFSRGFLR